MFGLLKKLFGGKPAETTTEVPYKVEVPVLKEEVAPAVVTPVAEKATEAAVKSVAAPKKKAAPKKAAGPKPAVKAKTARNKKPKSKPQA